MSRRTRMPTLEGSSGSVVLLRVCLLTVLYSVARIRTQGLPPAPRPQHDPLAEQDHHRHTFHVSRQLPDGQEMKVYLFHDAPERLFYFVEESHTPLQLTVTPCASPIVWSLRRKPLPPDDFYDQPDEDPFKDQVRDGLQAPVLLGNWTLDARHVYSDPSATPGLYELEITSTRSDSRVHVLATSSLSTSLYPALPGKRDVEVTHISERTFTFRWPDAAAINGARQVEYCVSVTTARNFPTHCALLAHSRGDEKPVLSSDDRWGFSWEQEEMRDRQRKAKPVKAMSARKMLLHQCLSAKRQFTFGKPRKGKTYYVDVYVVDKVTHKSESFLGTSVTMPRKHVKSVSSREIMDGERKVLMVKKNNVPQMVTFKAGRQMPRLSVELGVCPGKIPFEIFHNSTRLHRSVVKKWKRVRMKNVLPGTYTIKFPRLKRKKSFVSLHVTSRPSALTLPRNMSIKVFDSMTTCSNVTVAWMGTHTKQRYCLYVKEAAQIRSLKRHKCSSAAERPKAERVLCLRYKNLDISKAVMSRTIPGLQPNTKYLLDVYLSRGRSGPVAFRSVTVKTKATC